MKKNFPVNWTVVHETYQGACEHTTSHGHGEKLGEWLKNGRLTTGSLWHLQQIEHKRQSKSQRGFMTSKRNSATSKTTVRTAISPVSHPH